MWQPDFSAVISLPSRSDRRAQLGHTLTGLGFDVPVVDALDAASVEPPRWWYSSRAAYGCAASHSAVLASVPAGADSILVLEDDAFVPASFQEEMSAFMAEVPTDWDVIMIGGQHLRVPAQVSARVDRCAFTVRTHAYLVRGAIAPELVRLIGRSSFHWDHVMGQYLAWHRTYAPRPFLIETTGSPSDIPDSAPLRQSDHPDGRNPSGTWTLPTD